MAGRLHDKVVIITGATAGIGKATAVLFAREGAKVVLAGRRDSLGLDLVAQIERDGGQATFVRTDVTVKDDIKKLVQTAINTYGRIDVLVNNAGMLRTYKFEEMDEVLHYDDIFNTNVKSCFMLTHEVIPYMLKQGKGAIVNVASIAAEVGTPFHASYAASKGAIRQFTKSLAGEYAKSGIRVNAVLPGLTTSEMVPVGSDFEKDALAIVPMGRAAVPAEIAPGLLFFASDESSFCTGATLAIDGGATCL